MKAKPIKQKLFLRLFKPRRKGHKARVNGATWHYHMAEPFSTEFRDASAHARAILLQ
jgi:hypothetical protein